MISMLLLANFSSRWAVQMAIQKPATLHIFPSWQIIWDSWGKIPSIKIHQLNYWQIFISVAENFSNKLKLSTFACQLTLRLLSNLTHFLKYPILDRRNSLSKDTNVTGSHTRIYICICTSQKIISEAIKHQQLLLTYAVAKLHQKLP